MLLRHRMQKQWQVRDGERLMAVTLKELEARPRTSMRPPPRLRETCTKPWSSLPRILSRIYFYSFPFVGIIHREIRGVENLGTMANRLKLSKWVISAM